VICAELCAGAGGAALGLEAAGFTHGALVEADADAVQSLKLNRPGWPVVRGDIRDGHLTGSFDLLSAGLPCTPHSRGGKQLGTDDERHLWSAATAIISEARPRAVMLETADAVLGPKFAGERASTIGRLEALGYTVFWHPVDCLMFGISQHRRRAILVAFLEPGAARAFRWPDWVPQAPPTVGELLYPRMSADGWRGAEAWRDRANDWAPAIVGGSEKHGGPDLGPSRTKEAWRRLGVNPLGLANDVPDADGRYERSSEGKFAYVGADGPMLTVGMAALLQGFPPDWGFSGGKTSRYRQVGNAFPPPAAKAIGEAIRTALTT
jgi:DNA (cytosine-5)-methyltransferase 1